MSNASNSGTVRRVLTYGTFDLLHFGHVRLLERLRMLGEWTAVGLSTDDFNRQKGKTACQPYAERRAALLSTRLVDLVFEERTWEQKASDVATYDIHIFAMGDDWTGVFDETVGSSGVKVLYLPRTPGVDSTSLRAARLREDT
jgi:glycerol-3-phosphate cytidylyltransferase